ncbi:MAG: hypothetical protein IPL84_10605 [Chitinophagaceae bacterium]|nr:hypothetical protein [Chitinophagaceae bacterium]
MKKIKLAILLLASFSFAQSQDMKGMDMTKKEQTQPVTYTCPMHPEIHATKPGNCPKCGMKLVKEKPKAPATPVVKKKDEMQMPKEITAPTTYTCPMHPEIHAIQPGNCPKCGMKLIKEKPKAAMPQKQDEMQMP